MSTSQRVLPYSKSTAALGEVIRFRYQTRSVYAVLVTERVFDILAATCLPFTIGELFLCWSIAFYVMLARRMQRRTREQRRTQRIFATILDPSNICTFERLRGEAELLADRPSTTHAPVLATGSEPPDGQCQETGASEAQAPSCGASAPSTAWTQWIGGDEAPECPICIEA
jgi:hypothetical protein